MAGTDAAPTGTERLYVDGRFNTDPDDCEEYGHELTTGAANTETEYRAKAPEGRAFLHAADYEPSPEVPTADFPLLLTTGRTLYHFHTRTKIGRAPQLQAAAPDVWVELCPEDAASVGVVEGDVARVESPRGTIEAPVRVCGIRPGVVFIPFHYGYWDTGDGAGHDGGPARAANELTMTAWDPVSKQPLYKVSAVRVTKVAEGGGRPSPAPNIGGTTAARTGVTVPITVGGPDAEATSTTSAPSSAPAANRRG